MGGKYRFLFKIGRCLFSLSGSEREMDTILFSFIDWRIVELWKVLLKNTGIFATERVGCFAGERDGSLFTRTSSFKEGKGIYMEKCGYFWGKIIQADPVSCFIDSLFSWFEENYFWLSNSTVISACHYLLLMWLIYICIHICYFWKELLFICLTESNCK